MDKLWQSNLISAKSERHPRVAEELKSGENPVGFLALENFLSFAHLHLTIVDAVFHGFAHLLELGL